MARDHDNMRATPNKYEVLVRFTDPEDKNTIYTVGSFYPRDGYTPTEERLAYLQSNNTALKRPVISDKVKK